MSQQQNYIVEMQDGAKYKVSGISFVKQNFGFLEFWFRYKPGAFDRRDEATTLVIAYRVDVIFAYYPVNEDSLVEYKPETPAVQIIQAAPKGKNVAVRKHVTGAVPKTK